VDVAKSDFRLQKNSPCIDAGTNLVEFKATFTDPDTGAISLLAYETDPTDILGNTRFIDGNGEGIVAWDIGAYEYNSFKPPRFGMAPQSTPEGWKLNLSGEPNKPVHVQKSSNLKDWEDIWSGVMPADGLKQVTDGDTGQEARFYRAFVPQ